MKIEIKTRQPTKTPPERNRKGGSKKVKHQGTSEELMQGKRRPKRNTPTKDLSVSEFANLGFLQVHRKDLKPEPEPK